MERTWLRITYFSTLYQKEVTSVTQEIRIEGGKAYYSCMGHGEVVDVDRIVKIESVQR